MPTLISGPPRRRGRDIGRAIVHRVTQLVLILGLFAIHEVVRGFVAGTPSAAFARAKTVVELERALGLFWEQRVQAWVLLHPTLLHALNWVYSDVHLPGTLLFAVWALLFRPQRFGEVRNVYVLLLVAAIPVYVLFPLAPPRFLPQLGFVDTVKVFGGINYDANQESLLWNPFAAMPSMHVAFALLVTIGIIRFTRTPLRWLALGYWLLIIVAVIATGNHYVVDAIAGSALTAGAFLILPRLDRLTSPVRAVLATTAHDSVSSAIPAGSNRPTRPVASPHSRAGRGRPGR